VLVYYWKGLRIGDVAEHPDVDIHLNDRKIDFYEGEKNRVGRVVYLR